MPRRVLPPLHLKIRVTLTQRMTKREVLRRLRRTVGTGTVQRGLNVHTIDWGSGVGRHYREGEYLGTDAADALQDFYRAILHPNTTVRVEVVDM